MRRPRRRPPRHVAPAFTLVELVVASTITVLVAVAAVLTLNGVTAAKSRAERQYDLQQEARVAVDAIATAIRNAFRPADPRDTEQQLLLGEDGWRGASGELPSDRIRFFTVSWRTIRADQPESDVREVEFGILEPTGEVEGETASLIRRTDPTRNPEPDGGGVLERLSDRVVGLNITFHDGVIWRDEWIEGDGWPVAVRADLLIAPETPAGADETPTPYMVSRTVSFPLRPTQAPGAGGGSGGGSGGGGGSENQGPNGQQQQQGGQR